jgi:hypothetical protein
LALLNQTGVPNIAGYLSGYLQQNLPHLNPVILTTADNISETIRQGMDAALAKRPSTQQQYLTDASLYNLVNAYTARVTSGTTLNQAINFRNGSTTKGFYAVFDSSATGVHSLDREQITTEDRLQKLGLDLTVLNMTGEGGCAHCSQSIACSTLRTPETAFYLSAAQDTAELAKVLDSVRTGFHELAHALDLQGVTLPSYIGRVLTNDKDNESTQESTADAFAALMMVREFGTLGVRFIQNEIEEQKSFGHGSAIHQTSFAMAAALRWAADNPDKLKEANPLALFQTAVGIGKKESLTLDELKQAREHSANAIGGDRSFLQSDYGERLISLRETLSSINSLRNNYQTTLDLGRLAQTGALHCPAPSGEGAAPDTSPDKKAPPASLKKPEPPN